jgi:hypothetical protein
MLLFIAKRLLVNVLIIINPKYYDAVNIRVKKIKCEQAILGRLYTKAWMSCSYIG